MSAVDDSAMKRLRQAPDIRVLMARPPAWLSPQWATVLGIGTYLTEKHLKKPMHPTWATQVGFSPAGGLGPGVSNPKPTGRPQFCNPRAPRPSCRFNIACRQPVLDGGLIDNCPVATVAGRSRTDAGAVVETLSIGPNSPAEADDSTSSRQKTRSSAAGITPTPAGCRQPSIWDAGMQRRFFPGLRRSCPVFKI